MAYASWYYWNCGRTQRKAATINQLACPSYSLYVQRLWYPMYYPGGMKAWVSPVQCSKPYSILAPTQNSNPGGQIQHHKQWPLHYHYTTTAHTPHIHLTIICSIQTSQIIKCYCPGLSISQDTLHLVQALSTSQVELWYPQSTTTVEILCNIVCWFPCNASTPFVIPYIQWHSIQMIEWNLDKIM